MPDHVLRVYESMLGLLCNEDNPTPLVRLNHVHAFKHTKVYAKLEWYNPFGALKDRVAASLINDAEAKGTLRDVKKLVEPTSGNTGMGLAMIANAKGYSLTTTLSNAIPIEKRTVLRFFGCDVIELDDALCPAPGAPEGAIQRAMEISEQPDFHMLNQYVNAANPDAHYRTTGPEIWRQTNGEVTHFVAGLGTCGTITGAGRFLKEKSSKVQVLGVHPADGHDIPGVRSLRQLAHTDFFKPDAYDGTIEINNTRAYELCLALNRQESIVAGPSSGMALAGALELIPDEPGNFAVVIFPDSVFKYTSSVRRHLPALFPASTDGANASGGAPNRLLMQLEDNLRNSDATIDMGDIDDHLDSGEAVLIDVRNSSAYAEKHVSNAINVPLADLSESTHDPAALPQDKNKPIITVCSMGKTSLTAALVLKSLGYTNVKSLNGGITAWMSEGYPTEQSSVAPSEAVSLSSVT